MLALKEFRKHIKGLPDLLPYAALIENGIILNKDGSFTAAYQFFGQDSASVTDETMAWISEQFSRAVALLGDGWMLHIDAIRTCERGYPDKVYPDPVTSLINQERKKFFEGSTCFATDNYIALTYRPAYLTDKLVAKATGEADRYVEKILEYFKKSLEAFEDITSPILSFRRLLEYDSSERDEVFYSEILSYINRCITGQTHPISLPKACPMYLDAVIGCDVLKDDHPIKIGTKFAQIIAIDGLPQESWPGMLSSLDHLAIEYRYNTRFICLSQYTAEKEIKDYYKGWNQKVFRFLDKMFPNPNAKPNVDALRMAEDAEEAKLELQAGTVAYGYLTSTIILLDENPEQLRETARNVQRAVQTLGFNCRIETFNAFEAWLGSLPANSIANIRRPMVHSLNLADLLPLYNIWTGKPINPCPFYPAMSPALAMLTTDGNTPFYFNIHVGDIGHMLVLGPTGSGKSTLLAFLAAQFRGYPDANIFGFDKGGSMEPLCKMALGDHYTIGGKALAGDFAFAPLQRIADDQGEIAWAEEWIENLLALQGVFISPAQRNSIHDAMVLLANDPQEMRSLSNFCFLLQEQDLKIALQHYTQKGPMGCLLDAKSDSLSVSSFMVFEIESLMEMGEKHLVPVLLYLFHRLEKALHGQPAIIILDEAWVMLGNQLFKNKIREWMKVMRKANCAVILATQSLSDAQKSGILDVLMESCPLKTWLANNQANNSAQKELYEAMGLNDKQINTIANMTPKRHYYLTSPEGCRKVELALESMKASLAFVGSSDKESLNLLHQLEKTVPQEKLWHEWLKNKNIICDFV